MARKQKIGLYDIGRQPVVPTKMAEGYETRQQFYDRLKREEQEAAARAKEAEESPKRALVAEYSRNLVALRKSQAEALLVIPSEELQAVCQLAPETVEGTAEQIGAQIKNAFETLQRELTNEGITLHASGLDKLKRIAQLNTELDIRLTATWRKIYEHAADLGGVFTSEDVTVPKPVATQPVVDSSAQGPTMDDLLNLRVTGSRDLKVAQEISDALYEAEMLPIYQQWVDHLVRDHNYHLTREDADIVEKWFVRNNKARLRHESYNEVRRYMILGLRRWPESMLTPDERTSRLVEQGDTRSFEGRQDIFRKMNNQ